MRLASDNIAAVLHEARLRAALTQQALADRLHAGRATIARVEAAKMMPSTALACRWLAACGFALHIKRA